MAMLWQGNPRNASLGKVSAADVQTAVALAKQSLYTLMRDPLPGLPVSFLGLLLLYLALGTVCAAYMQPAGRRTFLRVMALLTPQMRADAPERKFPRYTPIGDVAARLVGLWDAPAGEVNGTVVTLVPEAGA